MEERIEIIKPIKKVIFKKNTQEQTGVKVNLTVGKEYDLLSVKMPAQYEIKPAVNGVLLYLVEDDNGEKNYFFAKYFEDKK